MIKAIHVVHVTTHGDYYEWEETERYIVHDLDEARYYKSKEFRDEQVKINGIQDISVHVEEFADTDYLKDILTVVEYESLMKDMMTVIDYNIPINPSKEMLDKYNSELGTNLLTTEEHAINLLEQIADSIEKVGNEGGWYVGDSIRVKVELEYEPEDK